MEPPPPSALVAGSSPFRRALLQLVEVHDRELAVLREQLGEQLGTTSASSVGGDSQALRLRPTEEEGVVWPYWRPEGSKTPPAARKPQAAAAPRWRLKPSAPICSAPSSSPTAQSNSGTSLSRGGWSWSVATFSHIAPIGRRSRWHQHSIYSGSKSLAPQHSVLMRSWRGSRQEGVSSHFSFRESRLFQVRLPLCQRLVDFHGFDVLCSLMIVCNAVLMGITADWRARNFAELTVPADQRLLDRVFTCWFLLELLLRVAGYGLEFFVHPKQWSWNVLDFVVVSADVANMLLDASSVESVGKPGGHLLMVRLLRVLRITKALLIVRIFRFFKELRMMVSSVLRSGSALLWSIALFMLNIFLFSVFFTGQVAAWKGEEMLPSDVELSEHLDSFFGTMARTTFTLFMSVSGGISWVEVVAPLHAVHWSNAMVFTFFIFFTFFALTNIITGIFVDTAIQSAQSDREEVIHAQLQNRNSTLQQMQEILEDADRDNDGAITLKEFEGHLNDKRIHAHLEVLGLHLDEARELFRLLDKKRLGAVAIEEFIFGCMRLKGGARSIDLATLMYENKKLFRMLNTFFDYVEAEFEKLGAGRGDPKEPAALTPVFCEDKETLGRETL